MKALLLALALLLAIPLMAAEPPPPEFLPRQATQAGWTWVETASWATTGHTLAKLGPVKVRDKAIDSKLSYACQVAVQAMEEAATSEVGVRCLDASRTEDGEAEELPVTGIDVLGLGVGPERVFKGADGKRLKKPVREFFETSFRDRDPTRQDPIELLLPPGAVAVGEGWDIDLDAVQSWFGPDRFVIDKAQSSARVTLLELMDRADGRFGRLGFKTIIVPSSIQDGEFEEARMVLSGSALLPLNGDVPYLELQLEMAMRYVGTFKAKGVKVDVDLDTVMTGFEKKEPSS